MLPHDLMTKRGQAQQRHPVDLGSVFVPGVYLWGNVSKQMMCPRGVEYVVMKLRGPTACGREGGGRKSRPAAEVSCLLRSGALVEPPRLGLPGLHAWGVLLGQTRGWGDRKASEQPDHGPGTHGPLTSTGPPTFHLTHYTTEPFLCWSAPWGFSGQKGDCSQECE